MCRFAVFDPDLIEGPGKNLRESLGVLGCVEPMQRVGAHRAEFSDCPKP